MKYVSAHCILVKLEWVFSQSTTARTMSPPQLDRAKSVTLRLTTLSTHSDGSQMGVGGRRSRIVFLGDHQLVLEKEHIALLFALAALGHLE